MKNKKFIYFLLLTSIIFINPKISLAYNKDKTIIINMNRTNLEDMLEIKTLKNELNSRGYISLMNIRGDGGIDDKRSYATIGAGRRANISSSQVIDFKNLENDNKELLINTTNISPKGINTININQLIDYNKNKGEYGATLGSLGYALSKNNVSVSVLGNADLPDEVNRNICLMAMDINGSIDFGNVDDINIQNPSYPFSISTDYEKLLSETKNYYSKSDVIFIELGDTYRLDLYKDYLNDDTYKVMKNTILNDIDEYLNDLFNMLNKNDKVYIMSAFPSKSDYANKKRLSPLIKFDGNNKGVLYSPSTKRDGIISNTDISADILNTYALKSDQIIGKSFEYKLKDDNVDYILDEFSKIVSISNIRGSIISFFINLTFIIVILSLIMIFTKDLLFKEKGLIILNILKEILKVCLILPLSFLVSPIYNFKSQALILFGIILSTIIIYTIVKLISKKNDSLELLFITLTTLIIIVIDCTIQTPLMKNSILSYDAIVGARYYGMGNEYQGIVIGSSIFSLTMLLSIKNIPRWIISVISFIVLFATASPSMGANVGASISEFVAFFSLLLLIYDVKIDFKKIILAILGTVGVVLLFILIDILSGSSSHLSLFVRQILENGPIAIIETFSRKISTNIRLAKTSMWVNILIIGIMTPIVLKFKPNKEQISKIYPILFKGFIANLIGCIITLLVNDSGIVSAATASLYITIPLIILNK